tara:strand:+ start:1253 stop:2125 length:873 start_codon:yes stop_codon:yes gene_type:complete
MRSITQSELVTLGRCQKLHKYKYIDLLRPLRKSSAMWRGTAAHIGIEKQDPEAARQYVLAEKDKVFGQDARDELDMTAGVVAALVSGAISRWGYWPARREVQFTLPLRNPKTGWPSRKHSFSGVLDGLDDDAVYEFKTTSRLDASYVDRLDIDFQVSAYMEAASRMANKPIRKVFYAIARWPSSKKRKNETPAGYVERITQDYLDRPDFYFHHETVRRTELQMGIWREEAWALHKRILDVERGGLAIRNTESCVGRFGRCAFLDLCCGAVTEDAYEKVDRPHQELTEGAA